MSKEFVPDEHNDFVQVATITNESERIVRVVAKGRFSFTIEVMSCQIGRYEWAAESVHVGRQEIEDIFSAVSKLPVMD